MRGLAAGNWKMNGTGESLSEIEALLAAHPTPGCEVLICPPATLLARLASMVHGTALKVGGQDCHAAASGAHTGDISAPMLAEAGADYVILGHSERRANHAESDAVVAAKVSAAQAAGLKAIVCVGETEAERDGGRTLDIITTQIEGSLPEGTDPACLVIAYEPVWAIGTGRTPTTDQIAEVHAALRAQLADRFGTDRIALLYGGSVKPSNAAEIFAIPHVNGALVGGASLKAADFGGIIEALSAA
ncbi:triose-phosphate isomerase [Falsirhodobacter sp. 20TX0035]|uniref:triose-phosphate isomerase n=1 Tax=Falsirhodobacter sp. 20TX0035 TaxID=3022019 RepID=UPI00232C5387|nr:triose-phosphate isomerase [Falsirhodobacter sp. 20TX0035]MDB6453275.1 triose-phosphate isomerase [Falsirhodobacter sp. 20TX0035]